MIDWPKTPERIWAWYCMPEKQNDVMVGGWDEVPDPKETEYTRSDLAAALLARAEAAEARVAMLEADRTWQPIETALKDGTWFVILTHGRYEVGRYNPTSWDTFEDVGNGLYRKVAVPMSNWSGFNNFSAATHWMPLPAPPEVLP